MRKIAGTLASDVWNRMLRDLWRSGAVSFRVLYLIEMNKETYAALSFDLAQLGLSLSKSRSQLDHSTPLSGGRHPPRIEFALVRGSPYTGNPSVRWPISRKA